ncbi:MAG TPA: FtsX-like permease family protein [Polyangiales bacterium]
MRRMRATLLAAEVALSFVFLIATALLVRSFAALEGAPLGFNTAGLAVVSVNYAHRPALADRDAVDRALVQSVAAVPGVDRVAVGGFPGPLLRTNVAMGPFAVDGPSGPEIRDLQFCEMPLVGAGYFRAIGMPLVQGRGFEAASGVDVSNEVVVNQALARRFWPAGHALGARLRIGEGRDATWLTVVGIAGDVHIPGLTHGDLFTLQMYRPATTASEAANSLVIRVSQDMHSETLIPSVRRAIERAGYTASMASMDPAKSVFDHRVMARPRFALVLFGLFAAIALAVSAVGLYSIVAYEVVQRTHEIGVRMALGAAPSTAARLVLATNARFVAIGSGTGLAVAYLGAKAMGSLLYGVNATDPAAFAAAGACLVLVAAVASLIPAWRAVQIDPVVALRLD